MKPKSKALQAKKDHSWGAWADKKDRFKKSGTTIRIDSSNRVRVGQGRSHISGNIYKHD